MRGRQGREVGPDARPGRGSGVVSRELLWCRLPRRRSSRVVQWVDTLAGVPRVVTVRSSVTRTWWENIGRLTAIEIQYPCFPSTVLPVCVLHIFSIGLWLLEIILSYIVICKQIQRTLHTSNYFERSNNNAKDSRSHIYIQRAIKPYEFERAKYASATVTSRES